MYFRPVLYPSVPPHHTIWCLNFWPVSVFIVDACLSEWTTDGICADLGSSSLKRVLDADGRRKAARRKEGAERNRPNQKLDHRDDDGV